MKNYECPIIEIVVFDEPKVTMDNVGSDIYGNTGWNFNAIGGGSDE